jgi:putative MATE family efflux protein
MSLSSAAKVSLPPPSPTQLDARTRRLIEAPITGTLLRLAAPNVLVMVAQASVGLIETFFIGKLGTHALAGVALVFPVLMLMQMMSAGAMGGGISSAIARALGARRHDDADALALHALVIAAILGLVFMLGVLGGGSRLYAAMGGSGRSLVAALTYSNVIFSSAILIWLFNSLANVIRGTGNMAVPAIVTCAGTAALVPLSPALIFGWGPFPRLDIAGGAVAVVCFYALGSLALLGYVATGRSVVRPSLHGQGVRWALFRDILRVGAVAALITIGTNLTIGISTALVGQFGPAAVAGYGTAARLEYLLIPLVFGLGAPLVAMVGTNIGAGQRERALRTAWIGAAIAAGLCETIGLAGAIFPKAWSVCLTPTPRCSRQAPIICGSSGPCMGCSVLAWRYTSHRRVPVACSGRSWQISRASRSQPAAAGSRCAGAAKSPMCSLPKPQRLQSSA